ncbi:hypothetical protein ASF70_13105 [Rhizobium sp. Leaf321]|uniref:hypothetical protein n=1 Tax=Rhizobium sp. Leaf321 TaxID=1736335 RepID=UPI0007160DA9|nr:hypothetical protein [Rhizobium sp. Leaf321]KQQ72459.1 hypothetical protein ASF70_13105 [Rhizobium sp. Leaf321]
MSEISDKLRRRVAQTLARMDRSDLIVDTSRGYRMPECYDYAAVPLDTSRDEALHHAVRDVRQGLRSGVLQHHDVEEFLAIRLTQRERIRVLRYLEMLKVIGDDRH